MHLSHHRTGSHGTIIKESHSWVSSSLISKLSGLPSVNMAQPSQPDSEVPTAEPPSSEPKDVLRLVCGWNDKTNTYLYRDEVINPPPLYGNGPERVSKRPKKASAKVRSSRTDDVKIASADAKPSNVSARAKEKMEKLRKERAERRGKVNSPL